MLGHHLRSNLFPPVSDEFVATAEAAIDLATTGDLGAQVELPDGGYATVRDLVTALQLQCFVDRE